MDKLFHQKEQETKVLCIDYLRLDGKVQVTVEYEDEKTVRIDTVIVSTQHLDENTI